MLSRRTTWWLHTVAKLEESIDGNVEVLDREGKGSRFHVDVFVIFYDVLGCDGEYLRDLIIKTLLSIVLGCDGDRGTNANACAALVYVASLTNVI